MKSRWNYLKEDALAMRRQGISMTVIEKELGIARSTLSGWFRKVGLNEEQRAILKNNSVIAGAKGRARAIAWHNQQKAMRLTTANDQAQATINNIEFTNPAILDLALAMLYWGEGAKNEQTAIASTDVKILKFVITVLYKNYNLSPNNISSIYILEQTKTVIT